MCILHEKSFRKTVVINVEFKYWNKGWINTQYHAGCFLKLPSYTGDTCLKRKSKKQLLKVSSHFLPAEIEHFSIREYSKSAIQSRKTEVSGLRCWPGATIFFHRCRPLQANHGAENIQFGTPIPRFNRSDVAEGCFLANVIAGHYKYARNSAIDICISFS